jgi:hypothetical protein
VHLQPAGGDRWCPRRLQRHGRGDLQLLGRRPLCRQDQPQGHGGAGRVAAAASRGTPRASCDAAGPVEFGGSLYRCHRILLRPSDSGSGGGLLVHAQPRGGTSRWPGRPGGRDRTQPGADGDAAFSVLRWLQTCWRSGSGAVASSSPSWCSAAAWALTAPRGCGVRLVDLKDLDLLGVQVVSQASAIAPVNSTSTQSTGPKPRSQPVSRRWPAAVAGKAAWPRRRPRPRPPVQTSQLEDSSGQSSWSGSSDASRRSVLVHGGWRRVVVSEEVPLLGGAARACSVSRPPGCGHGRRSCPPLAAAFSRST